MGLFDRFRKQKSDPPGPVADQHDLFSLCYAVAYFILPHYAFSNLGKVVEMWRTTPASAGPFFYLVACQMQEREPQPEDAPKLRAHCGRLDERRDYYVLEYPEPPPIDLTNIDLTKFDEDEPPLLAPHFSAVVVDRDTQDVSCVVLGQAPMGGGTTFRELTADNVNSNLGPGSEPQLEPFLGHIRKSLRA